jgi:prepilin-type N-terminal cleavage/methylation domain-containing protein
MNNGLKSPGFTLVEMLVALAIFSLLITALLSGFHRGLALWEQSVKKEQIWQTLLLRQQWLRSLFNQTLLGNYSKSQEDMYVPYFQGSPLQMRLITAAPLLDNPGQVRPVQLKFQLEADTQNYTLYYLEGSLHSDPDRDIHWSNTWIPLLQHLKQGHFSYEAFAFPRPELIDPDSLSEYAKQRYREHTEWLKSYDTQQLWLFPRRVKIHFTDAQNSSHEWQFLFNTDADVNNLGFIEDDWF